MIQSGFQGDTSSLNPSRWLTVVFILIQLKIIDAF